MAQGPAIYWHCLCGASWKGCFYPRRSAPEVIGKLREEWNSVHSGAEHGPCDATTAMAARNRKEKKAVDLLKGR